MITQCLNRATICASACGYINEFIAVISEFIAVFRNIASFNQLHNVFIYEDSFLITS